MRVVFLPDGGFQKSGGFIELDDGAEITGAEEVYQRQGYLTLRLTCRDTEIRHGVEVWNEEKDADPTKRSSFRAITATGDIQKSRWGRFSLSILGRTTEHSSMGVTIRENEAGEAVFAAGMSGDSDLDHEYDESFFVDVVITRERMDTIIRELQMPGAELRLDVRVSHFPMFYAPWSPSIDEGRVIKFLDRERDVENAEDVPDDFWNRDFHSDALANAERRPVNIAVVRRLGRLEEQSAPRHLDNDVPTSPDMSEPETAPAASSDIQAIHAASGKIARRLTILAVSILLAAVIIAAS